MALYANTRGLGGPSTKKNTSEKSTSSGYRQINYGSQGSSVSELQKMLNQNGYSLDTDGIYGSKTLAAVKDYQQKNGLSVDGIVGNDTWGALTGSSPSNASTKSTSKSKSATAPKTSAADMKFSYDDYEKSDIVKQAEAMLNQQLSQKPGDYTSQWHTQLNEIMNKILNREDFSYDLNGDALYQQYKDQYTTQGKLAMIDTMGQAQAMTGGYGNSYAQSVGQQAYQGYLQQLNEVVPELYQMALDQYNQEGDEMYNQYSLLGTQEEQDYNRYRDTISDYYTELDRLTDDYRYKSEDDYTKYNNDRNFDYGQFSDDRSYAYQSERDAVSDDQWQKEFAEAQRQYNEQMSLTKEQWALEKAKAAAGGDNPVVEEPVEEKITYSTIAKELNTFIAGGASKSKISAYIRGAVSAGYINQNQAQKLLSTYVPRGYTY